MHYFCMTIGDWSDDGHGKHEDFRIESNFPVECVREAHFHIKGATGIDIESICSAYEEDEIEKEVVDALKEMGFQFEDRTGSGDGVLCPQEMARLWVFLLQKADSKLHLNIMDEDTPTLHFYGYDKQNRHIGCVGYGLFA